MPATSRPRRLGPVALVLTVAAAAPLASAQQFRDETSARFPSQSYYSNQLSFCDVDGDGDLDVAFADGQVYSSQGAALRARLYINDGTGSFTDESNARIPVTGWYRGVEFGDVDRDGDWDMLLANDFNKQPVLLINDGTGVFTDGTSRLPARTLSSARGQFGDVDSDGDLDLLGANAGTSNREILLLNDGTGTSWTDVSSSIIPNPTADDNDSKFIDWDMDGDLDFVIAALFASTDRFYRNNGSGSWIQTSNMQTSLTDSSLDIGFADLDGDGAPDLVTAQGESGSFQNRIYMNQGPSDTIAPTFGRITEVSPGKGDLGPFAVRAAIFDQITSDRGFMPRSVELLVSIDGGRPKAISMDWSGNSIWRGTIPAVDPCSSVSYQIRAEDRAGNVALSDPRTFETGGTCGSIADLDGDGSVNGADLGQLISQWGGPGSADFNGNGIVDGGDLGTMIAEWTG